MGNYKVYIYAISKNERKNVDRWVDSMSEADGIYVLDTGSNDGTPEALRARGVHVTVETVSPWRFDTARNRALALVPEDADLCVCTDLDEQFRPGWREKFEAALAGGAQRVRYRYTWSFASDGREGVVFMLDKAHARHGWSWVNPVHEVLKWTGMGAPRVVTAEGAQLDHRPDPAKSRAQYLPLLELAVEENPENDRNMHYLGREYMFRGMWKECEATLKRHLALSTATWRDERCASMRFLARAALRQGRGAEAEGWLLRAAAEAPSSRFAAEKGEWAGSLYFAEKALAIRCRSDSYINEAESWGSMPADLAAVAAYRLGLYGKALDYGKQALALEPDDPRLRQNMDYYLSSLESAPSPPEPPPSHPG